MSIHRLKRLIEEKDTRKILIQNYLNEICEEIDQNGGLRNYDEDHAEELAETITKAQTHLKTL